MTDDAARSRASRRSFRQYWTAAAISSFGTAITAVAMPVFVVQHLHAPAFEVGLVNAAQFLPYALLGLPAGAYVDRWRRKPVLVWSSIGRALSLGLIPLLWIADVLQTWMLIAALLLFGASSVFGFAATQSLLPRLVSRGQLVTANSRLDQTDAAAQTLGPAAGGSLVGLLGAPAALLVDSISYLVEAALVARIKLDEPRQAPSTRNLRAEMREGLQWTYRHPTLGRLAGSTHVWFLANGAAMTILALLALRALDFSAAEFGLLMGGVRCQQPHRCLPGASSRSAIRRRTNSYRSPRHLPGRVGASAFRERDAHRSRAGLHRLGTARSRRRPREFQRNGPVAVDDARQPPRTRQRDETIVQPHDGCGRRTRWWCARLSCGRANALIAVVITFALAAAILVHRSMVDATVAD